MKTVVVIPCYNVSDTIEAVVNKVPSMVQHIILVNDCSTDQTASVLESLSLEDKRTIVIHHTQNKGVGGAVKSGYAKALELDAEYIVKLDGDGQMDPMMIESLVKPLKEHRADYTKGNRFHDFVALRDMPVIRRIGNLGLSFLLKAASGYWNVFDPTNGFTAIHAETLKKMALNRLDDRYFFESSMLLELYYSNAVVKDVPIKAIYNNETSHLSVWHSLIVFPGHLFAAFFRRIVLKYFLYDFNIGSVYFLLGTPLFLGGSTYGVLNFVKYTSLQLAAPTGTVVIPALLIILGFQLLLAALHYDIQNYPTVKNGK